MSEFNTFEKLLIGANFAISIAFLVLGNDYSWLAWTGLIASISNTVCVVLVAKQKISNYVWGTIAVVAYGIVAYAFGNTGEWTLNWLYYFPMNIVGWLAWKKQRSTSDDVDVDSKSLTLKQSIVVYSVTLVCVLAFAWLIALPAVQTWFYGSIASFGFEKYFIDSLSTTLSVVAMILMVQCYREQWILWIVVDMVSIILWCFTFDPMMILMWATMLVNAVYGYFKWKVAHVT